MKKMMVLVLSLICAIACVLGLAACGKGENNSNGGNSNIQQPPEHTHSPTLVAAKPATCTENGNTAYYTCTCDKWFWDAGAMVSIFDKTYVVIPASHSPTLVAAKSATCTENGNMAYYTCTCGKWFYDVDATTEIIDKTSVTLNATGHSYSTAWEKDQTQHWHRANCAHTSEITAKENHTYNNNYQCTACGYQDTSLHGTEIASDVFTINGNDLYVKIPNSQTTFSFLDAIRVADGAGFDVGTDIEVSNPIRSKTVEPIVGDNTYYIRVENGKSTKLYTAIVRRRPIHTVTFDTDGGTAVDSQQVEEDNKITAPVTTKTGYTFVNWQVNGKNVAFPYTITENTTIAATWRANTYTLTARSNNTSAGSVTGGGNYAYDSTVTLTATTYSGYTWLGWYNANDEEVSSSLSYTLKMGLSATYTAKWTAIEYTATFKADGNVVGTAKFTLDESQIENVPMVPAKTGYTGGWERYTLTANDITINAVYTANKFTIVWKNYDGKVLKTDLNVAYGTTPVYSGAIPTKESDSLYRYVFGGWMPKVAQVTGNAEYTARFSARDDSYTIKYDANGGTNAPNGQTRSKDQSVSLDSTIPTRNGYVFMGWQCAYNGSTYSAGSSFSVNANVTLYAVWGHICTDCNGNGGITRNCGSCGGTGSQLKCRSCGSTSIRNVIGGGFSYQQCNSCGGTSTSYSTCSSCSGSGKYRSSCYTCNGAGKIKETSSSYSVTLEDGNTIWGSATVNANVPYRLNVPAKSGYSFVGWYDSLSGGNRYTDDAGVGLGVWNTAGNKTLYAQWRLNRYEITYDCDENVNLTGLPEYYTILDASIALTNQTRTGYTFAWEIDDAVVSRITTATAKDVIVKGVWTPIRYSVSYELDGGTNNGTNPLEITIESGEIALAAPTRMGYSFVGWAIDGTTVEAIPAGVHENLTISANWRINQYTISFVTNGGSALDPITLDYNVAIAYPKSQRNNYSFDGWFLDELGQTACAYTSMPAQNITLYAKWKNYAVTISYDTTIVAIKESATINAELLKATAIDTDGTPVNVTATLVSGSQQAAGTITIRLRAVGLYSKLAQVSVENLKVYGNPTITYDTQKDYFNLSDTLNGALFAVAGVDSFGNATTAAVSVREERYSAGDSVTIVLTSTDAAGNVTTATVGNVKVYGTPQITYDLNKTAIKATDVISNALFSVSAVDSFGVALECTTALYSGTQSGGNTITVSITVTDSKQNVATKQFTVKVYGIPTISAATKMNFKVTDEISATTLGVVAKDSFNAAIKSVSVEVVEGSQTAGSIITLRVSATDAFGNTAERTIAGVRIFGMPVLTYDTQKTVMKVTDTVNVAWLSAIAQDSFYELLPVTVSVKSGGKTGGTYMVFTLTATDKTGNAYSVDTAPIGVYDANEITLIYRALASDGMKRTSCGEEFSAIATDSFGAQIPISVKAASGTLAGGNVSDIYFTATDAAGNIKTGDTIRNIKIYDLPQIVYDRADKFVYADEDVSLYISAVDNFGELLLADLSVTGTQTAGQTLIVTATAIDMMGNQTVKVFSVPVLARTQPNIVFDANGGIPASDSYSGITNGQETYTLPIATREYYTFFGWYGANNKQYTDGDGNAVAAWDNSGTVTLYAHYAPVTYGVQYELNGGEQNNKNLSSYTAESATLELFAPAKTDYTFMGWFENAELSGSAATQVSLGVNRTYYAKWAYGTDGLKYVRNNEGYVVSAYDGAQNRVVIPETFNDLPVTAINDGVFGNKNLISITIPNNVTSIGNNAFSYCSGLTSVTIGNAVTSIGDYAFYDCSGLTRINYTGDIASWCGISGLGNLNTSKVYINGEKLTAMTSITIPEGVKSIGSSAFSGCSSLTSITIPNGVTSIGDSAFSYCRGLTSVTIGNSVTSIGDSAFSYCRGLTSVTIGNSVTSIENRAFYNCSGLTSITIGNSITSIGKYAFYDCSGLTRIDFNGMKAQWKAISKGSYWNYNTGNYTVHCTDGDIAKA